MKERILEHLLKKGSITSWDAIVDYGCTRLSHYIWLLKKDGYKFEDENICFENRYGEHSYYKSYKLVG